MIVFQRCSSTLRDDNLDGENEKKTKKNKHNSWNRSGWFTEFTHAKTIALWQWPSKDQLSRRLNPTTLELLIPIMKIWKELESSNHSNNLQKFPLIYYRCQIMEQPKSKYQSVQKSTKIYCFTDTRDNDYFWFSCIIIHILMGDEWVCDRDCMCVCVYLLRNCLTAVGKPCQISIFEIKTHVLRGWHEAQAPPCFTRDLRETRSKWSGDLCDINGTHSCKRSKS